MSIEVVRPGLLTSVQDLGRSRWRKYGVIVGGAMDPQALRVANLLIGNEPGAATLEATLVGPVLRFLTDGLIAICGGDFRARVEEVNVPLWRPVWIRRGSELRFGTAAAGCRAYLAVAGGIDVPQVLGSRSTYFRAGLGGFAGRSLRAGDCLAIHGASPTATRYAASLAGQTRETPIASVRWFANSRWADYGDAPKIRVTVGRQYESFSHDVQRQFFSSEFTISANSDRMGYRLAGPPLPVMVAGEQLSEATTPGTIQVPANGNPIVLMADSPVTGGYPKIAQVASVDLPVLAQLRPGAKIHFQQITIADAQALYREREADLTKLQVAIAMHTRFFG